MTSETKILDMRAERREVARRYFSKAFRHLFGEQTTEPSVEEIQREVKEARKRRLRLFLFSEIKADSLCPKFRSSPVSKPVLHVEFLTTTMLVRENKIKGRKRRLLCRSLSPTFNEWIDALDLKMTDVFQDNGVLCPISPVCDDGIIETSAFTKKYGGDEDKKLLVYDLDNEIIETAPRVGDTVQMLLKLGTWTRGWSLDIVHVIHHTPHDHAGDHEGDHAGDHAGDHENIEFSTYIF